MEYKRIQTYIKGLDEAIGGGFTRPGLIYVVGHPGTGKTTLSIQFAYNRAMYDKEKTKYFLLTEPKKLFLDRLKMFKFEHMDEFIGKYLDVEEALPLSEYDIVIKAAERVIEDIASGEYKNLIVDSISSLMRGLKPQEVTSILSMLFKEVVLRDMTTIIIGEIPLFSEIQLPSVEEFIADVVIRLDYVDKHGEGLVVRLTPIKSRIGPIDRKYYEVQISPEEGFIIVGSLSIRG